MAHDLQPLLDVRQNQLNLLFSESSSVDTKGLALIATDVGILIFAAQASLILNEWQGYLLVGSYLFSIVMAIMSLWTWPYIGAGISIEEHPEYLEFDNEVLVLQLISDTELAIYSNKRLNRLRWRLTLASFIFMITGTLALFATI